MEESLLHHDHDDHDSSDEEEIFKESKRAESKLIRATLICTMFMTVEMVGGYLAGSLAVMTDAAHLLSDVAGFVISLLAVYLGRRQATVTLSFGFKRAEVIGAVISIFFIGILTAVLILEGIRRTRKIVKQEYDDYVDGKLMSIIAFIGLLSNLVMLRVLGHNHSHGGMAHPHKHSHAHGHSHGQDHDDNHAVAARSDDAATHHLESASHASGSCSSESGASNNNNHEDENINVSAAYVHVIGDLVQSVGVCIAGILIWIFPGESYPMMQLCDPIATFLFSILVMLSTVRVMRSSLLILMEGTPDDVNLENVLKTLKQIPGVSQVAHLHIWSLTLGSNAMSAHLLIDRGYQEYDILCIAHHKIRQMGIYHATLEVIKVHDILCKDERCRTCEATVMPSKSHGLVCFNSLE